MNPFLLTPSERLSDWKHLRHSLADVPEPDQLSQVARYFAQAPLLKIAYDIDDPATWPGPWEMIHDGNWCRNSVAIGMEFTLRLAGFDRRRLQLAFIRDLDDQDEALILAVTLLDGSTVWLNHLHGTVASIPPHSMVVLSRYAALPNGYAYASLGAA